jgi:hypothetical protein
VTRSDITNQLLRFLNDALSAEDLSAWAGHAIVANDNANPPLPVHEHDFLEDVLTDCLLARESQFELSKEAARTLMEHLRVGESPSHAEG